MAKPLLRFRSACRPIKGGQKPGRNTPCPCGSGVKYKRCHGATPGQPDPTPVAEERG